MEAGRVFETAVIAIRSPHAWQNAIVHPLGILPVAIEVVL
jgi:hypothetical protein